MNTPGPWVYEDRRIWNATTRAKAICLIPGRSPSYFGSEEDARLIAAAPDLLNAAEALLAEIDSPTGAIVAWPMVGPDHPIYRLAAAIRKATRPEFDPATEAYDREHGDAS